MKFTPYPLCLGGNVFGWTADERTSFDVLDAYAAAGGDFIDTADVYSAWAPGNTGGESESILGRWMKARERRERTFVATKVGMLAGLEGLGAATIARAGDASLARLGTDRIDLYYAHRDDPKTPLQETLGAFHALVVAGKVREVGASNYTAARLAEALAIAKREGFTPFTAIQPHYNLVHRAEYEGELAALCAREGIACMPYFGLARGFLTGKYRPGGSIQSARAQGAMKHLDERGLRVLEALDAVAAEREVPQAAVALAWLKSRPTVVAPIASARTLEQLTDLLPMATFRLTNQEAARLDAASGEGVVDGGSGA